MGDHIKIVPNKIKTEKGEIKISEKDIFIELIYADGGIAVNGITPKFLPKHVCLVKIFEIHKFDAKNSILWQIAEGLINRKRKWFFGYDDAAARDIIMTSIQHMFVGDAIRYRKSVRIVVRFENKELIYLEVINNY